jgi:hypothetical protein
VVVALVVLAGCGGVVAPGEQTGGAGSTADPAATPATETPGAAARPTVTVEGSLPVDADRAFERTARLVGTTPTRAPTVTVDDEGGGRATLVDDRVDLLERFGVSRADGPVAVPVGGYATSATAVGLAVGENATPGELERALVHEFVHVLQFQRGAVDGAHSAGPRERARTTDRRMAARGVVEGAAVYVTSAYVRQHLSVPTERAVLDRHYPDAPTRRRLSWAPYRFGADHVAARVEGPATHWSVYDDPPVTTEQLLDGPATGPPRNLTVRVDGPRVRGTDSKGELYVRELLADALSRERARRAADGWGDDRALALDADGASVHAWVLRFDTADDAAEFRPAVTDFLATVADRPVERDQPRPAEATRVLAPSPSTVVVLAGQRRGVEALAVTATGGTVTVGAE